MHINGFPVYGDGYWAEVKMQDQYLRLFSGVYELGHVALVYDMNAHCDIDRQNADDLEDAKKKAEKIAAEYVRRMTNATLPPVEWKMNAQTKLRTEQF